LGEAAVLLGGSRPTRLSGNHAHAPAAQLREDAVVGNGLANHGEDPAAARHLRLRLQLSHSPPEKGKISRRTALKCKTYLSSTFSAVIRLEAGITRNPVRAVKLTVEEPQRELECRKVEGRPLRA
jgi:hypothetical protein